MTGGFDEDEAFKEELDLEYNECQLMDAFEEDLDNFPFEPNEVPEDDDTKRQFIFHLLRKLANFPDLDFGVNVKESKC